METTTKYLLIAWALWNLITFALMGIDKVKAKYNMWRIPESTLLTSAFLMGAAGSFIGSKLFHHKTRKKKFSIGLPLALLANLAAAWFIWRYLL